MCVSFLVLYEGTINPSEEQNNQKMMFSECLAGWTDRKTSGWADRGIVMNKNSCSESVVRKGKWGRAYFQFLRTKT